MKRLIYCCWLASVFMATTSCKTKHALKQLSIEEWQHPEGSFLDDQLNNDMLELVNAFELKVEDRIQLGGISSINIYEDGTRLLAISDYSMRPDIPLEARSRLFHFDLKYDGQGKVEKIRLAAIGGIYDSNGQLLAGEMESIGRYNNTYYASLDNGRNRADTLWQLAAVNGNSYRLERPLVLKPFPEEYNREGIEALTELDDGRLWAIHERLPGKKEASLRNSWIVNPGDGHIKAVQYQSTMEEVKGVCRSLTGGYFVLEKTFFRGYR